MRPVAHECDVARATTTSGIVRSLVGAFLSMHIFAPGIWPIPSSSKPGCHIVFEMEGQLEQRVISAAE
jgi:hypothetical protein